MYERKRGKKLDYYWYSYCKGFHLTSIETWLECYGLGEMMETVVAAG